MTLKSKKPGCPKKYASTAERVAAYRKRQKQVGETRFDIFLSIEATAKVMRLSSEQGWSASRAIESLILTANAHSCSNLSKKAKK